jgi:hypothetical protein
VKNNNKTVNKKEYFIEKKILLKGINIELRRKEIE